MLYILGGAARTGKTIISRNITKEKGIPCFSIDFLISSLQRGAPELKIKHGQAFIPKANKLWRFTRPLMESFIRNTESYTIEGDGILPKHVNDLSERFPNKVKACFLGFTKISEKDKLAMIRKHEHLVDEWTSKFSDEEVVGFIDSMIKFSKFLKAECDKYSIPFIEVEDDLPKVEKEVKNKLFDITQ